MTSSVDAVFDALGDPMRRQLFATVAATGPVTATQLADPLPITRQAVSKQLAILADAGLISATRTGRENRFAAVPEALDDARAWMDRIGQRWDDRLRALQQHVAESRAPSAE